MLFNIFKLEMQLNKVFNENLTINDLSKDG